MGPAAEAPGPLADTLLSSVWARTSSVWDTLGALLGSPMVYKQEYAQINLIFDFYSVCCQFCFEMLYCCLNFSANVVKRTAQRHGRHFIFVGLTILVSVPNRHSMKSSKPGISVGLSSPGLPSRSMWSRVNICGRDSNTLSRYPRKERDITY